MIFFIYGNDHYRCQEKIKELTAGFKTKKDQQGLNIINLDGPTLSFNQFKQEVLMLPFLSESKFIIIKNISENNEIIGDVIKFLSEKKDLISNNVVFLELLTGDKKKNRTSGIVTFLKQEKYCWQFEPLNTKEAEKWIYDYFQKKSAPINYSAIIKLVSYVGNDTGQLVIESEKLIAFKNGTEITSDDVSLLVNAKIEDKIFELVDALGQKNQKAALRLTANQLRSGSVPLALLGMFNRQFKNLLLVKNLNDTTAQTAKELGMHPFVLKKSFAQSKNFSLDTLKEIFNDLTELEIQFKTGAKNPELLLNLFIVKYC